MVSALNKIHSYEISTTFSDTHCSVSTSFQHFHQVIMIIMYKLGGLCMLSLLLHLKMPYGKTLSRMH